MVIYQYYVSKSPGTWSAGHPYPSLDEAREVATLIKGIVVEVAFTFDDSEVIEDYRESKDIEFRNH